MASEKGGKVVPVEKDIQLQSVDNIIAKLFRKILIDLGANTPAKFSFLLDRYMQRYGSTNIASLKVRSSEKNNLRKELLKDRITFKIFASRAIRLLGILKFDLTITLHHPNGMKTPHTVTVTLMDETEHDPDLSGSDEED